MAEHFKVGERVRLLHESGEGVVTAVLGPHKLEVMIDDFLELEVGTDEVVKIHAGEVILSQEETDSTPSRPERPAPVVEAPPSFVVLKSPRKEYELWLLNRGSDEVLYSVHLKIRQKYYPLEAGHLLPQDKVLLGKSPVQEFHMASSVLVQTMRFRRTGSQKPVPALRLEFDLKKEVFSREPETIAILGALGYELVLEEKPLAEQVPVMPDSDYVRVRPRKEKKNVVPRSKEVVDLHIDKLVSNPAIVDTRTMLDIQMEHFEQKLREAQEQRLEAIVFIHGIGTGRLKEQLHRRLGQKDFVESYELADPIQYGNGATLVWLSH